MCGGTDAGGNAELRNMQSPICNASEYTEELQRCIGDASEKCRVQYAGSYSDTHRHWADAELMTIDKRWMCVCACP